MFGYTWGITSPITTLPRRGGRANGQSSGCFTAPPSPWLTNRLRPLTEGKQHMTLNTPHTPPNHPLTPPLHPSHPTLPLTTPPLTLPHPSPHPHYTTPSHPHYTTPHTPPYPSPPLHHPSPYHPTPHPHYTTPHPTPPYPSHPHYTTPHTPLRHISCEVLGHKGSLLSFAHNLPEGGVSVGNVQTDVPNVVIHPLDPLQGQGVKGSCGAVGLTSHTTA